MKPGKYTISEIFANQNIEQILIPEIQRDYVWRKNQIENLFNSLTEDFLKKINSYNTDNVIANLPADAKEIYIKQKYSTSIGFIYAYNDVECPDKFFLIDGQQRLTTIYLIMISIANHTKKTDDFKQRYYRNDLPKIDYKVREASHNFLYRFVAYILNKLPINEIEKQFWYYSEYKNDYTIQSIIENYKQIEYHLNALNGNIVEFGRYIEDFVNFWYFDTNISEQGEELYIYMNSRGETVQPSENIKALLLENLNENNEKNIWGEKWEDWQNFFWRHRKNNKNADKGFNSFLRWIQQIEKLINDNEGKYTNLENLRELETKVQDIRNITIQLPVIEQYISAFRLIIEEFPKHFDIIDANFKEFGKIKNINEILQIEKWTTGDDNTVNKITLFPLLHYAKSFLIDSNSKIKDNINWLHFYRFARFFYNVSQLENVSKSPYISYKNTLHISNSLIANNSSDITSIVELVNDKSFTFSETILTDEELYKLSLYKLNSDGKNRNKIEQLFWSTEDYNLNENQIRFILSCSGITDLKDKTSISIFDYNTFIQNKLVFETLLNNINDLFRRALLTKGDYLQHDGTNPSIGGERYYFGYYIQDWKSIIWRKSPSNKLKELIVEICQFKEENEINKILGIIVDNYLQIEENKTSWMYNFIKYPELLDYCKHKRICWIDDDEIYLLSKTYASSDYIEVQAYIDSL